MSDQIAKKPRPAPRAMAMTEAAREWAEYAGTSSRVGRKIIASAKGYDNWDTLKDDLKQLRIADKSIPSRDVLSELFDEKLKSIHTNIKSSDPNKEYPVAYATAVEMIATELELDHIEA